MNRKPSWGLWLLMIIAPLAVFFGIHTWRNRPLIANTPAENLGIPGVADAGIKGAPIVSRVYLYNLTTNTTTDDIGFYFNNPVQAPLSVRVYVVKGAPELTWLGGKKYLYRNGDSLGGIDIGPYRIFRDICGIKKIRKQTIHLQVRWRQGRRTGFRDIFITPQMKAKNNQKVVS